MKMVNVNDIVRYEEGEMHEQEEIEFFQALLDTGMIFNLQGHYQRQMDRYIESGLVDND